MNATEFLGYLASFIIAVSFTIKNINLLRFINSIGAGCFVVYGVLIDSNPVTFLNSFILFTNTYYVVQNWVNSRNKPHDQLGK